MVRKRIDEQSYSMQTRLIYGLANSDNWDYSRHINPPISASTAFRLGSSERGAEGFAQFGHEHSQQHHPIFIYDRLEEPNNNMLEDALALAEGAETAVCFSSGMAAIHAAVCFRLKAGDEVLCHETIYGCTYSLFTEWLPKFGVKVKFINLTDIPKCEEVISENTRVVYFESPANPNLEMIDIEAVSSLVRVHNKTRSESNSIITIIDNTFATPWCQRTLEYGVDLIVHSLTKAISGFGTEMGGAVVGPGKYRIPLRMFRKDFGGSLSPASAWHILVYGLSTLALRVPKQQATALKIAQFLESHPKVQCVNYPGLPSFPQYGLAERYLRDPKGEFSPGFMIYFVLKADSPEGQKAAGVKLMNYLAENAYTITLAVSLGQLRTLIEHPASMTHSAYPVEEQVARGIDPGGIRLAIGIEETADIVNDLNMALDSL